MLCAGEVFCYFLGLTPLQVRAVEVLLDDNAGGGGNVVPDARAEFSCH